MRINNALIGIALVLLSIAGYRMGILKFDRGFKTDVLPLAGFAAFMIVANFWIGRAGLVQSGAAVSMNIFIKFLPVLVFMFITMGMATVLIGIYKESLMASLAGGKGIVATWFSSFLIPGSMTSLPVVKDLWEQGASKPALISFVLSSRLVSVWLIMMFVPMLGWRLAMIQYGFAIFASVLVTLAAWLWTVFV